MGKFLIALTPDSQVLNSCPSHFNQNLSNSVRPCLVIFPIGLFLSFQAMRDATGANILKYFNVLKWFSGFSKWGLGMNKT